MDEIDGVTIDLAKYGLEQIADKPRRSWTESELDSLLDAFYAEDIYPTFNIEFSMENIEALLDMGKCRKCGRCCLPNPDKPDDPGVMIHEDDLKGIAKATGRSYSELAEKTSRDQRPGRKHFRIISYPCLFHSETGCKAYGNRPVVCRVYPLTSAVRPDKTLDIKINLRCDYGRDIYKALHAIMTQQG